MRCGASITIRTVSVAVLLAAPWGCGVPRSVDALIGQAGRVIDRERAHLEADQQRVDDRLAERRASLTDGFEADLDNRQSVERDWYRRHAEAYATAREAVLRQAMNRRVELDRRRDNLAEARRAQRRALVLIDAHRRLFQPLAERAARLVPDFEEPPNER